MKNYKVINRPNQKLAAKRNLSIDHQLVEIKVNQQLSDQLAGKKAYIATYGCQSNVRDGEIIIATVKKIGYIITDDINDADLIIFNTCAIREMAEDRVYGELGRAKGIKKHKKDLIIALCGCMAQEEKNITLIETKFKQVDIVFGPNNIADIPALLLDHLNNGVKLVSVSNDQSVKEYDLDYRHSSHSAFVQIMHGCDRFCTYCIVPYVRGAERSRKLDDIEQELRHLYNQNYIEVTLVGQNVNAYGKGLNDGKTLVDVLKLASSIGFKRIRFITSNVSDFTDEMLEVMASDPSIMPHLHLPLQSGDNQILKAMNRGYNVQQFQDLYCKLRGKVAGIAITTDIIVGFPQESDEQFQATIDLCKRLNFDGAYTFVFSPRPGTPAANMVDDIDLITKKQRLYLLNEVIAESAKLNNSKYLFTNQQILINEKVVEPTGGFTYSGYTKNLKLTHFKSDINLDVGTLVIVKIIQVKAWTLTGELDIESTIIEQAGAINGDLKQEKVIQEYNTVKEQVLANTKLIDLENQIKSIRQQLVNSALDEQASAELIKQKNQLELEYTQHPLIITYRNLQQLVLQIKDNIQALLKF